MTKKEKKTEKEENGEKEVKTEETLVAEILRNHELDAAELLDLSKKLIALKAEIAQNEGELAKQKEELSNLFGELKEKRKAAKSEADTILAEAKEEASRRVNEAKEEENRRVAEAKVEASGIVARATKEAEDKLQDVKARASAVSVREAKVLSDEQNLRKRETDLVEREENARKGFVVQFDEAKAENVREAEKIKAEIEKLKQDKLDIKVKIEDDLQKLRDKRMAELEAALENRRLQLDWDIEENNQRAKELDALELERRRLKDKTEMLQSREEGIEARVETLLEERYGDLIGELEEKRQLLNQCMGDKKELKREYDNLVIRYNDAKNENIEVLKVQIEKLKEKARAEQAKAEELKKRIIDDGIDRNNLEEYRTKYADYNDLQARYKSLLNQYEKLSLEHAKKMDESDLRAQAERTNERLKKTNEELRRELEEKRIVSREERLEAIRRSLPSLQNLDELEPFSSDGISDEMKWLEYIRKQANLSGIEFSDRLLQAYHTSLKIGEWSPLVVLAGVSGTGKSELPRQYALHGGMNFLSVAVKPDWDSPQSLFGYYNSIENKFEPTELLRALYQMQESVEDGKSGQMLMVLLDEMNLAHVELYFSDLLSKFETRRGTSEGIVEYEISLGAGAESEILRIGGNILWTGTMNEDETTKALSDKVIDRSTLITFPRPKRLIDRRVGINQEAKYYLEQDQWKRWLNDAVPLEGIDTDLMNGLRKTVEDINGKMSALGRNLGHRVWQSIQNYIVNYPEVISATHAKNETRIRESVQRAFTEAVAFKVMPKLRGVETSGEYADVFDEIAAIVTEKIPELADDFKQARSLPTKIFMWHTAKFLEKVENE